MTQWRKPNIEIIHGDCMDYMATLEENAFELAIVDPPYGIGEDGGKQIEWKSRPNSIGKEPKHKKKNWDVNKPDISFFNELQRISKNQIIWGGNYFTDMLAVSGAWIVWDKLIEVKMFTTCELAWTSLKNNQINRFRCHPFDQLRGGKIKIHPTQKPVQLYKWLLAHYAKEGDRILDTHGGSMSLALACWDMGFDCTIIEIDEDYYKAGLQRFQEYSRQDRLF